mmetsp:Transcript_51732/g.168120  ORF Transcript_51732/g.168120 Transcript_51732/m.168120 type:complete len:375 (-) Transcript_51732:81-1205(-)
MPAPNRRKPRLELGLLGSGLLERALLGEARLLVVAEVHVEVAAPKGHPRQPGLKELQSMADLHTTRFLSKFHRLHTEGLLGTGLRADTVRVLEPDILKRDPLVGPIADAEHVLPAVLATVELAQGLRHGQFLPLGEHLDLQVAAFLRLATPTHVRPAHDLLLNGVVRLNAEVLPSGGEAGEEGLHQLLHPATLRERHATDPAELAGPDDEGPGRLVQLLQCCAVALVKHVRSAYPAVQPILVGRLALQPGRGEQGIVPIDEDHHLVRQLPLSARRRHGSCLKSLRVEAESIPRVGRERTEHGSGVVSHRGMSPSRLRRRVVICTQVRAPRGHVAIGAPPATNTIQRIHRRRPHEHHTAIHLQIPSGEHRFVKPE